jgi:hypothetical protein
MTRLATSILFVLAVTALAQGSELSVRLRLNKPLYHAGEKMNIEIICRNLGPHPIRFLTEPEAYAASSILLRELNGKEAGKIIPFGEMGIDFKELSKEVIVLKAGETHTRRLNVQVASTLPPSYEEKMKGLFLWFQGSNIQVPHSGQFQVVARYRCSSDHPVRQYIKGRPQLWSGEAESPPIRVELRAE